MCLSVSFFLSLEVFFFLSLSLSSLEDFFFFSPPDDFFLSSLEDFFFLSSDFFLLHFQIRILVELLFGIFFDFKVNDGEENHTACQYKPNVFPPICAYIKIDGRFVAYIMTNVIRFKLLMLYIISGQVELIIRESSIFGDDQNLHMVLLLASIMPHMTKRIVLSKKLCLPWIRRKI